MYPLKKGAFAKQARSLAAEEDFIRRNIAGTNSAQAKGRRRRLERVSRLSPPPGEDGAMALRLAADERGGDQVLVAEDLALAIGSRTLLRGFDVRLMRGEVVGLVGPNGAGKSTLLRAIAGERPADGGELRVPDSVRIAYYRQDLAQVPAEETLYDIIAHLRPHWGRGPIQGHLGRFGFSGDAVKYTTPARSSTPSTSRSPNRLSGFWMSKLPGVTRRTVFPSRETT